MVEKKKAEPTPLVAALRDMEGGKKEIPSAQSFGRLCGEEVLWNMYYHVPYTKSRVITIFHGEHKRVNDTRKWDGAVISLAEDPMNVV